MKDVETMFFESKAESPHRFIREDEEIYTHKEVETMLSSSSNTRGHRLLETKMGRKKKTVELYQSTYISFDSH